MDNQRLLVWATFGILLWFTYQTWMQDYGPAPVTAAPPTSPSSGSVHCSSVGAAGVCSVSAGGAAVTGAGP